MPTVMLLLICVLCAAFYLYAYFAAEAPKKGTLEWIGMYEKPLLTRKGLLQRLKWLDILWCALMGLLALALYAGLSACVDYSMTCTSILSGWLFLSAAPTVLMAMAAYLLGKCLSGRFLGGLVPVLFLGCSGLLTLYSMEGLLMPGCLLLMLVFFTGKGFWAWISLVLSGILLAFATWEQPTYIFFALPWLGTVLFAEILRIKQDDAGPWHLILALLTTVATIVISVTFVHGPMLYGSLSIVLQSPDFFTLFWRMLMGIIPARLFAAPEVSPVLLLPAASLLLAGPVMAVGAVNRRQAFGMILLLWTVFGLLQAVLFPVAPPVFLSVAVLVWLFARVEARGYRAAALVTGLVPTVITIFVTILTLWRNV